MTALLDTVRRDLAWSGMRQRTTRGPALVVGDDPGALEAVFEDAPVESFASGRTVFWEGDRAEHVFKVLAGVLRICRILPNGRRAITGFAFAGDVLGLSSKDHYLFSGEAITPVKALRVTRRRLDGFPGRGAAQSAARLRPRAG